jgi:hypothetical protein
MIEFFDNNLPTGQTVFIQVKGTKDKFKKKSVIKLSGFPSKTVNYSRLFDIPFFVFYTSITSKKTYFLWLQKYADLNYTANNVLTKQKSITLNFPSGNNLSSNRRKFSELVQRSSIKADGIRFLSYLADIQLHWKGVQLKEYKVAYTVLNLVEEMIRNKRFMDYYLSGRFFLTKNPDFSLLKKALRRVGKKQTLTLDDLQIINKQIGLLEEIERIFLGHNFIDELQFSGCSEMPY